MSGDNLQPFLDAIEATIHKQAARIRRADRFSLGIYRSIGQSLCDAREALKFKPFLAWADEKFGYKNSWVTRLLWLHREWKKVEDALASAGDRTDTKATRAKYTPDGAYLLVKESEPAKPKVKGSEEAPPLVKESPTARLERELSAANRFIVQLMALLRANRLQVPPLESDEAEPSAQDGGGASAAAETFDGDATHRVAAGEGPDEAPDDRVGTEETRPDVQSEQPEALTNDRAEHAGPITAKAKRSLRAKTRK